MLAFTGVILLATLARTVGLSISLKQSEQSERVQTATQDARAIAAWATQRWERPPEEIRFSLGTLARLAEARVWLVSAEGRVRVDTQGNPSWEGATIEAPELSRVLKGEEIRVDGPSPWLSSATAIITPVRGADERPMGAVFLFLPLPDKPGFGPWWGALLWSAVVAMSLAAVAAFIVSRRLAAPLEEITAFARELGHGPTDRQVAVRGVSEVNELAATLTRVSANLKLSFDALAEERQRLAAILESMQEGVLAVDGSGRLIMANPAAVRLLRWQEAPALPAPLRTAIMPDRLRQALEGALLGRTDEELLRLGSTTELLAVCTPVSGSDGQAAGAAAVLSDMTSVMRLQRVRENFIADVAHELRGPLANLSLLAEAFGDGTIPWQERDPFVQSLQREVAHLRRLSRDVLDLAQLDAGVMHVTLEPVQMAALAAAVLARLGATAAAGQVTLRNEVEPELVARASYLRMEQVLGNLVENALRYTPAGGTVTVSGHREGASACLQVKDTGQGIAAEHLPSIFERFYKVDPSRTRTDAGTGLGLAVVKQLVELQGGTVDVTSEVGVGTEFRIWLQGA